MDLLQLMDNSKRAQAAKKLFIAWLVIFPTMTIINYYSSLKITHLKSHLFLGSDEKALMFNLAILIIIISIIGLSIQLILSITFIKWLRRAYANLFRIGYPKLFAKHGWAAGAWFVPIVNLFVPYEIMKETWKKTIKIFEDAEIETEHLNTNIRIVGWWWALFIISNLTANFTGGFGSMILPGSNPSENPIGISISAALLIASGIITFKMIQRFSVIENELYSRKEELNEILNQ